ncbi:hypothetical protein ACM3RC_003392 [Escherichia coli]|uniref:hypothetical protein n=1 Tax=Escherichia coli TaxID=562 RepID=UPI0030EEF3F6
MAAELLAKHCPYGQPGDRIWVRETYRVHGKATDVATLVYRASVRNSWTEQTHRVPVEVCNKPVSEKWTPSIHMPRWASRILLVITNVRVERLNDISECDARAEGAPTESTLIGDKHYPGFRSLWKSIYGEDSWNANPWVPQIPATDAFLAEVRAQGVDAAIEAAKNLVAQEYEYKDFKAAQSDCCMHPGSDLVGKVEMTEWLVDFAAQLRKGGNQ